MALGAAALPSLVPDLELIASSPLIRAVQTADVVAAAYGGVGRRLETAILEPGAAPEAFAGWLKDESPAGAVAAVGHEPHLSELVGWLLSGRSRSLLELKKGAACLLALEGSPGPGAARLLWALAPAQLRRLAEAPG